MVDAPRVMLLDGDYDTSLSVAAELSEDLDATIVGVGTRRYSRLLRSKYCDAGVTLVPPEDQGYAEALLAAVEARMPDLVLPLGYHSTTQVDSVRDRMPGEVALCIPPSDALRTAADKTTVLDIATRAGFDVPGRYTDTVETIDAAGRPCARLSDLSFPLFVKARRETGNRATARVDRPVVFWEAYDRVTRKAPDGEVIVQEYVDGPASTFGCGLLFLDGELELLFGQEEVRSVPRYGGSGTHLRVCREPALETKSVRLLRDLGWSGVALVEYKKHPDGTPVLMEINPKFWASYALASHTGYRFASTFVAGVLDLDVSLPVGSPQWHGEMVFPLRELNYYLRNRGEERLLDCLSTIARPGVSWDVEPHDLGAWLTPPADLLRSIEGAGLSRPSLG